MTTTLREYNIKMVTKPSDIESGLEITLNQDCSMLTNNNVEHRININDGSSSGVTCLMCMCGSFLGLIVCGLLYLLPIIEIVMAIEHKNDMQCDSFISPYTWLIVQGILGICIATGIIFTCGAFSTISNTNENENMQTCIIMFSYIFIITIALCDIVWLIIGSVMFWRDCYDLKPSSMNTLFWVVLIMSWMSVYGSFQTKNDKK